MQNSWKWRIYWHYCKSTSPPNYWLKKINYIIFFIPIMNDSSITLLKKENKLNKICQWSWYNIIPITIFNLWLQIDSFCYIHYNKYISLINFEIPYPYTLRRISHFFQTKKIQITAKLERHNFLPSIQTTLYYSWVLWSNRVLWKKKNSDNWIIRSLKLPVNNWWVIIFQILPHMYARFPSLKEEKRFSIPQSSFDLRRQG